MGLGFRGLGFRVIRTTSPSIEAPSLPPWKTLTISSPTLNLLGV